MTLGDSIDKYFMNDYGSDCTLVRVAHLIDMVTDTHISVLFTLTFDTTLIGLNKLASSNLVNSNFDKFIVI